MKVFIVGSKSELDPDKRDRLDSFCYKLGVRLGKSDHQVIVCSAERSAADFHIMRGIAASKGSTQLGKLVVHRPDDETIKTQWREVEQELGLDRPEYTSHSGPVFRDKDGSVSSREGLRMCFLICQMAALKECDVIVAIGGRVEGPAAFILAIAREQRKLIIPFRFLGGASERVFNQIEGDLRQNLGGDVEKLSSEIDGEEDFLALIQILHSKSFVKPVAQIRIFLSYSWRRGEYADFVEATVRRMENVFLFRDESEIISGDSISAKIDLELTQRCNVFLALWGREYVESPHCYDEMHRWYEMNGLDRLCLLRFDDTRPVWPILRKTRNDTNEFVRRWPRMDMLQNRSVLERELRSLINRMTPL